MHRALRVGLWVPVIALAMNDLASCGKGAASFGAPAGMNASFVSNDEIAAAGGTNVPVHNAINTLLGTSVPVALWSEDHQTVIYNSWTYAPGVSASETTHKPGSPLGTPSIRIRTSGQDRILADGAQSIAWTGAGPIAYFKAVDRTYVSADAFVGNVEVQAAADAPAEPWTTTPGRYTVLAWANGHLLFQSTPTGREAGGELLVADGPGRIRSLAPDDSALVAISPDGQFALVVTLSDVPPAKWWLVDVATGHASGKVSLGSQQLGMPGALGSWDGDAVVVSAQVGTQPGLVVFTAASPGAIPSLTATKTIFDAAVPLFDTPFFTSQHAHVAAVSLNGRPGSTSNLSYVVVDCVVSTSACQVVALNRSAAGFQLTALRNPSRPSVASHPEEES